MRLFFLILTLASAMAQDIFVPYFASSGNNLLNGVVAYWRFQETSGTAFDSGPNGFNLTQVGAIPTGVGIVGNGRSFDDDADDTDYLEMAYNSTFKFAGDFSMSWWVNMEFAPPNVDDKTIISRGNYGGSNFSWLLMCDNGPTEHFSFYWSTSGVFNSGNVVDYDTGDAIAGTSGYYHVVVRRSGTMIRISATHITLTVPVEGAYGTAAGAFYDGSANSKLRVGALEGSAIHGLKGVIDEGAIYNRYISDCEVQWLFTQKAGSFTWPGTALPAFDGSPCAPPTGAPVEFASFGAWTGSATRNNSNSRVGHEFTPSVNMTVTQLGRYKLAGNTGSRTLYLQTKAGVTLGQATVNLNEKLVGQIGYDVLEPPVALTAGTAYAVVSQEVNGSGVDWADCFGAATFSFKTTHIGSISGGSAPAAGGAFTGSFPDQSYGPVGFKYTVP